MSKKYEQKEEIRSLSSSKYYSREAEESILGIILNNPEKLQNVISYVRPTDFFFNDLRELYKIIFSVSNENRGTFNDVDIITYAQQRGMSNVVNYDLLGKLVAIAGYSNQTDSLVHKVVNLSEIRAIEYEINNVVGMLNTNDTVVNKTDLLKTIENKILTITRNEGNSDLKNIRELNEEFWSDFNERRLLKGQDVSGISSGFSSLNNLTNGFQRGELIIVAARPSVGKTAFALNLAINALKTKKPALPKDTELKNDDEKMNDLIFYEDEIMNDKKEEELHNIKISSNKDDYYRVALFSLEMPNRQLLERMYSMMSVVPGRLVKRPDLITNEKDYEDLANTKKVISNLNLFIDDSTSNEITELAWKLRRLNKMNPLDLVIVDYLQLISGGGSEKGGDGNRQNEITKISRTLKQLALELDVPVIALSQLSRNVERRENKIPMLSDLRESGAIEQDADIVMFLYRPEVDNDSDLPEIKSDNFITDIKIIIAKNRSGPTETVALQFMGSTGLFTQPDKK